MNPNQPIFDAITAATRIENDYGGQSTQAIIIDVQKFIEVFNNHRDRELCTALSTPVLTDSVLKSAPAAHASHNSGEGDPSVMLDCAGADTDIDARTGTADDQGLFALPDGEAVAWPTEEIIAKEIFALIHPGDWNSELCIDERRESLETAKAILALFSPPASASATEANVVAGARAIAAARGHDPDALAPRTEMCGADNLQVPWWKVFEEEAEACLKVASPASAGVLKHADELHDLGFKAGWSGAIEECAKVADTFTCGICGTDGSAAAAIRALASGEK